MTKVGDLMNPPTEVEKQDRADRIIKTHFEEMEDLARAGAPVEMPELMKLETDGGKCPRCGKLWKEVVYDLKFGKGRYFKPDCRCYLKCWHCDRSLYREVVIGEWQSGHNRYRNTARNKIRRTVQRGWQLCRDGPQELKRSIVMMCPNCGVILRVIETLEEENTGDGYVNKGEKKAKGKRWEK